MYLAQQGRAERTRHFAGWKVLEHTSQTFPAPENTEKVFATIIAEKV